MKNALLAIMFALALSFASPCSAQSPEVFEQSDSKEIITLQGQKFTVAGDGNGLTVFGSTPALVVTGNNNTIRIQAVDSIEIAGDNNRITWSAGASRDLPQVHDQGEGNAVNSGPVSDNDE